MKKKHKSNNTVISMMFWSAFITSAIIEFAAVGSGLIDGLVISKMLGPDSMAAEGIVHPYFSIAGVISGMLMVGMQTMCTSFLARGKVKEMQRIFTFASFVALIASTILAFLLVFFSDDIAILLGARGKASVLLTDASSYLKGLSFGTIPMIITVIFSSAVQMDSDNRLVQIAALSGSATDIVLDIIFANLGYGMFGIGIATSLSYVVNLAVLSIHFIRKDNQLKFRFEKIVWRDLLEIASIGSEKALRRITNTIRPVLLNGLIIYAGGALGMSALSIRNSLGNFAEIPMMGIAGATSLLSGMSYGEKDKEDCQRVGRLAQVYIIVYSLILLIIAFFCSDGIADYYVGDDAELRELVKFSIYALAIGILPRTLLSSRTSYLQSTRQVKKCQILTFLSNIVVIAPSSLICVFLWKSRGVIVSFAVADYVLCLMIMGYYYIKRGVGNGLPSVDEYLSLPVDFEIHPKDIIELDVHNIEEAVLTSEQLQLFCKGHDFDPKRAYKAALCLEEITKNIIEYGFSKTKNIHEINVRVRLIDNDIIIRIRDHCPKFDLKERIALLEDEEDPFSNIGIKLVNRTAQNVEYVYVLQTNTVIITL